MRPFFAKVWGYWGALGHEIGRVMTPVHMFIVYVLVFGPANLILRIGGKDPLERKNKTEATSWKKKESHPATLENLRHTF